MMAINPRSPQALKGRARVGAERRKAIIDAAIEVFAQRGFRGSALTEVAERVGLTAPGVLYHFGSKERLLLEVIAERDRRQGEVMAEIYAVPGLESLRGAVRFAEIIEGEPGLAALFSVLAVESLEPDHPAHAYFKHRDRYLRTMSEEWLRDLQAKGEVRADIDCAAKSREIWAFLFGASQMWLTDRSVSLVELYRNYFELFIASVRATRPSG